MTRRERHLKIIESFGDSNLYRYERDRLVYQPKLKAFSDEAVESLARNLMVSHRRSQVMNTRNRDLLNVETAR